MGEYCLIYSSCPDEKTARALADALLDRRFAACVSVLSGVTSYYVWQGKRESSPEALLMIKTTKALYAEVEALIRERHPYELPEVIAVPIEGGLPDYLGWIASQTQTV
ncbi:MAG: divalent cation tolerance protein CutA [Gammaproteobacteria bacterium]|nr:divalent cation tolerance protein CutA [Gammaproteobacteria bacterium]